MGRTLSAYEEFLGPEDVRYIEHALGKHFFKKAAVDFTLLKEYDPYSDEQHFCLRWKPKNHVGPATQSVVVSDLEGVVQMVSAIAVMEQ